MGVAINHAGVWYRAAKIATTAGNGTLIINGEIVHRDGARFAITNNGVGLQVPTGFTKQTNGRFRPNASGWNFIGASPADAGENRPNLTVTIRDNSGTRWRNSTTLPNGGAMAFYAYSDWEIELSASGTTSSLWHGVAGPAPDLSTGITPFAWRPTATGQSRATPSMQWLVRQSNDKATALRAISPDGTQSRPITFPGSAGGTALLDCRWPDGAGTVEFQAGTTGEDMYFTPVHIF